MADYIHQALSAFRDTILTAVARLEFQLRDVKGTTSSTEDMTEVKSCLQSHKQMLAHLSQQISSLSIPHTVPVISTTTQASSVSTQVSNEMTELLKIQPSESKNVLVIPKAVVAQESDSEDEVEESVTESEEESVTIEEPGDDCGATKSDVEEDQDAEQPSLTEFEVDGEILYRDEENAVYRKTGDEEYEQIGEWDPNEEALMLYEAEEAEEQEDEAEDQEEVEDQEEAQDEEEALECESFVYKGKTYLRDAENTVYNEDGEEIGTWNGKAVLFTH